MSRHSKQQPPQSTKQHAGRYVALGAAGILILLTIFGFVFFWPDDPADLYREARLTLSSDPVLSAELAQRAVISAGGNFPDAHLLWCRALARQNLAAEAAGCFIELPDPQRCSVDSLIEIAEEAAAANQPLLQTLALKAANRPGPRQGDVLRRLTALKYSTGEMDAALSHCETWRKVEPDSPDPLWALLSIHQRTREFVEGIEVARQLRGFANTDEEKQHLRKTLIEMLVEVADKEGAREELDAAQAEGRSDPEIRLRRAELLRLEGNPEAAVAEVDSLFADGSKNPRALMVRGVLHLDLGNPQRARQDLEEVVRLQPEYKEAHYKLALALRQLGETDKAEHHLTISQRLTEAAVQALRQAPSASEHKGAKKDAD